MTDPLCVSIAEAARLLGISETTAYEAAREGRLPVLKWGSRWVVSVDGIRKMLEVATERAIEAEARAQEQGRVPLVGGRGR